MVGDVAALECPAARPVQSTWRSLRSGTQAVRGSVPGLLPGGSGGKVFFPQAPFISSLFRGAAVAAGGGGPGPLAPSPPRVPAARRPGGGAAGIVPAGDGRHASRIRMSISGSTHPILPGFLRDFCLLARQAYRIIECRFEANRWPRSRVARGVVTHPAGPVRKLLELASHEHCIRPRRPRKAQPRPARRPPRRQSRSSSPRGGSPAAPPRPSPPHRPRRPSGTASAASPS